MSKADKSAIREGKKQADEILAFRTKALRKRREALAKMKAPGPPRAARGRRPLGGPPATAIGAPGVGSAGVLVAEGDSWFDYPFHDVLRYLEDEHGYDVESVAHKGDPVEDMAYGMGQLEELARRIEKVLRAGITPKAILLSGGGNDVAGDQFRMLLNHARSGMDPLNENILTGVIDERIRSAYITILSAVSEICKRSTGRSVPVLVHGYDYPVPDGRGYMGGWWVLPGPWLEPGFREKGYTEMTVRIEIARTLIERLNSMLQDISKLPAFASYVTYINLMGTLSTGSNYKKYWANELHPTSKGFRIVTQRFVDVIEGLP